MMQKRERATLAALVMVFIVGPTGCRALQKMPEPLPGTNTYQLRMPGAAVDKVIQLYPIFILLLNVLSVSLKT